MTPNDLTTEKDIEAAFHSAVTCFQPAAGLKETVAARLSSLNASEVVDRSEQTNMVSSDRNRATRRILRWAAPLVAACLLIGIGIFALSRSDTERSPSRYGLSQTSAERSGPGTSGNASAKPVGGVIDPWLADTSPEVVQCRSAWQAAREEDSKFEPTPPGITADQQRATVVAAYENAIAMMPDAPPVPDGLMRIAHLWMGAGIEPEQPRKALEAYQRVLRDFPGTHHALAALGGKASAYYELHDIKASRETWQQVLAYQLPANADARWARQLEEARLDATKWLAALDQPNPAIDHAPLAVSPRGTHGVTLGRLSLEQRVGRASLLVRTRVAGWDHGIIRHNVVRVIYGDLKGQSLLVDYSGVLESLKDSLRAQAGKDLGHEPTPTELDEYVLKHSGIEKGKEMILFLIPRPTKPDQALMYIQMGSDFDVPPKHRLDDSEDAIIRIIADGSYLSPGYPQPADVLEEHIRAADMIVRAQLSKVTETDSRWTVTDVIKGKTQEKTLILPHDLFRLRAEAIIRHRRQATQPATQPSLKQQIVAEMNRLIQAELVPNQRAVLFVSDPTVEGETVKANLLQRIYEDASGKRLDEAVRAIRAAESHQLPVNL